MPEVAPYSPHFYMALPNGFSHVAWSVSRPAFGSTAYNPIGNTWPHAGTVYLDAPGSTTVMVDCSQGQQIAARVGTHTLDGSTLRGINGLPNIELYTATLVRVGVRITSSYTGQMGRPESGILKGTGSWGGIDAGSGSTTGSPGELRFQNATNLGAGVWSCAFDSGVELDHVWVVTCIGSLS